MFQRFGPRFRIGGEQCSTIPGPAQSRRKSITHQFFAGSTPKKISPGFRRRHFGKSDTQNADITGFFINFDGKFAGFLQSLINSTSFDKFPNGFAHHVMGFGEVLLVVDSVWSYVIEEILNQVKNVLLFLITQFLQRVIAPFAWNAFTTECTRSQRKRIRNVFLWVPSRSLWLNGLFLKDYFSIISGVASAVWRGDPSATSSSF
ncbi:MAG: hypothetical protein R2860_14405 [Desulfobacterales bacterium]